MTASLYLIMLSDSFVITIIVLAERLYPVMSWLVKSIGFDLVGGIQSEAVSLSQALDLSSWSGAMLGVLIAVGICLHARIGTECVCMERLLV